MFWQTHHTQAPVGKDDDFYNPYFKEDDSCSEDNTDELKAEEPQRKYHLPYPKATPEYTPPLKWWRVDSIRENFAFDTKEASQELILQMTMENFKYSGASLAVLHATGHLYPNELLKCSSENRNNDQLYDKNQFETVTKFLSLLQLDQGLDNFYVTHTQIADPCCKYRFHASDEKRSDNNYEYDRDKQYHYAGRLTLARQYFRLADWIKRKERSPEKLLAAVEYINKGIRCLEQISVEEKSNTVKLVLEINYRALAEIYMRLQNGLDAAIEKMQHCVEQERPFYEVLYDCVNSKIDRLLEQPGHHMYLGDLFAQKKNWTHAIEHYKNGIARLKKNKALIDNQLVEFNDTRYDQYEPLLSEGKLGFVLTTYTKTLWKALQSADETVQAQQTFKEMIEYYQESIAQFENTLATNTDDDYIKNIEIRRSALVQQKSNLANIYASPASFWSGLPETKQDDIRDGITVLQPQQETTTASISRPK